MWLWVGYRRWLVNTWKIEFIGSQIIRWICIRGSHIRWGRSYVTVAIFGGIPVWVQKYGKSQVCSTDFKLFRYIYLFVHCVCMYVCTFAYIYIGKWSHICPIEQMGVRGQFGGASSLLLPFGFWDWTKVKMASAIIWWANLLA